jgi:hypothetical protein
VACQPCRQEPIPTLGNLVFFRMGPSAMVWPVRGANPGFAAANRAGRLAWAMDGPFLPCVRYLFAPIPAKSRPEFIGPRDFVENCGKCLLAELRHPPCALGSAPGTDSRPCCLAARLLTASGFRHDPIAGLTPEQGGSITMRTRTLLAIVSAGIAMLVPTLEARAQPCPGGS